MGVTHASLQGEQGQVSNFGPSLFIVELLMSGGHTEA